MTFTMHPLHPVCEHCTRPATHVIRNERGEAVSGTVCELHGKRLVMELDTVPSRAVVRSTSSTGRA